MGINNKDFYIIDRKQIKSYDDLVEKIGNIYFTAKKQSLYFKSNEHYPNAYNCFISRITLYYLINIL